MLLRRGRQQNPPPPKKKDPILIPGWEEFFSLKVSFKKEIIQMEKNKNKTNNYKYNNSSNSLFFGRWPQTKKYGNFYSGKCPFKCI